MVSEGDHPFNSPPCYGMLLGEGNIPRRLKAFQKTRIAWGLKLNPIACDVIVEITKGPRLVSSPMTL